MHVIADHSRALCHMKRRCDGPVRRKHFHAALPLLRCESDKRTHTKVCRAHAEAVTWAGSEGAGPAMSLHAKCAVDVIPSICTPPHSSRALGIAAPYSQGQKGFWTCLNTRRGRSCKATFLSTAVWLGLTLLLQLIIFHPAAVATL